MGRLAGRLRQPLKMNPGEKHHPEGRRPLERDEGRRLTADAEEKRKRVQGRATVRLDAINNKVALSME
jgi:hypothetical protein